MRIARVMSRSPFTCSVNESLNSPARLMWEHDCGVVPVVGDDGRLQGVVTDRDVCMAAYTQGKPLDAIPVATAMAKQVFSCLANDTVEAAERLMRLKRIRRIPVVDENDRPIGLISLSDIARERARVRSGNGWAEWEFVQTVGAICEPRPQTATSAAEAVAVAVPEAC